MLRGSLKSLLSAVEVAKIKMAREGTDDFVCEFFTCDGGRGWTEGDGRRERTLMLFICISPVFNKGSKVTHDAMK